MAGVGLALRALTLGDFMRAHQGEHQHHKLDLVATAVQERVELDRPVDQECLDSLAAGEYRVVWTGPEGREVDGVGEHYADGDPLPALDVGDGSMRLRQSSVVIEQMVAENLRSGLVLGVMMTLLAAAVGLVLARLLSALFQQLAHAAAALGRGRFELDLPETRIPEAVAIGDALRASGRELQGRLEAMSEMGAEVVQRARGSLIADGEVPLLGILD